MSWSDPVTVDAVMAVNVRASMICAQVVLPASPRFFKAAIRPLPPRSPVNVFAIHSAGRLALFDFGAGTSMGPTLGKPRDGLAYADIDSAAVDTILLTHIHPDHSNGLSTDEGGRLFPNARVRVHRGELAHWMDDHEMDKASLEDREQLFLVARRQLEPYRDVIVPFERGEIFPGVAVVPLPGHTSGHSGFLTSGGESLLIWGDAVHYQEIQAPQPEVGHACDIYLEAAASRRLALGLACDNDWLVAGASSFSRVLPRPPLSRKLPDCFGAAEVRESASATRPARDCKSLDDRTLIQARHRRPRHFSNGFAAASSTLKKLSFCAARVANLEQLATDAEDGLIDLRKAGAFRGMGSLLQKANGCSRSCAM